MHVDSNGSRIQSGRRYVISKGSRSCIGIANFYGCGEFYFDTPKHVDVAGFTASELLNEGYTIERLGVWTQKQAKQVQLDRLIEIDERASACRQTLKQLEQEAAELLHAGYTEASSDQLLAWIYDGRGTPEEMLESIMVGS